MTPHIGKSYDTGIEYIIESEIWLVRLPRVQKCAKWAKIIEKDLRCSQKVKR